MRRATAWEQQVLDKLPPCDPSWPVESVAAWLEMFDRVLVLVASPRHPIIAIEPPY